MVQFLVGLHFVAVVHDRSTLFGVHAVGDVIVMVQFLFGLHLVAAVHDRSACFGVHAVGDLIVQIPVFQQETVINGLLFFQLFQTCGLVSSILGLLEITVLVEIFCL